MNHDETQPGALQAQLRHALRARQLRRRWRQGLGLALLLAGYACLAVPATSSGNGLLLRVGAGFALLFLGAAMAIGPVLSALLDTGHD